MIRACLKRVRCRCRLSLEGCCGVDIHAATIFVEADGAVHEGENGVIFADADIATGDPLGAALTEDDVASDDGFAAEFFHAETLAVAIASIFDASLTFLMSHDE